MSFARGPLVWVIEDDDDNREVIADVLASEGFRVRAFVNGQEPLDAITCGEEAPALILLDLGLPVLDGEGFLAARVAHRELATVPFVVMSGFDATHGSFARLGATAVLAKPFDLDDLLRVVGARLESEIVETQAASA